MAPVLSRFIVGKFTFYSNLISKAGNHDKLLIICFLPLQVVVVKSWRISPPFSQKQLNTFIDILGVCKSPSLLELVLQKVPSELHPKVRNHGEGPY